MYLADQHTHTKISPDSDAPLAAMARAALAAGLSGLWVTDHFDLLDAGGAPVTRLDWPPSFAQLDAVRGELGDRLELRLGLELGSVPFDPAAAEAAIHGAGDRMDFVLGSLHNWIGEMGNTDFYFTSYVDDPALCQRTMDNDLASTWTLVSQCPRCYDSLAHIIYPLRYMERDGQSLSIQDYEGPVRDILKEVARTGHAMEVNTCRGRDVEVWRPLLAWFRACGGEYVTLGSDAHRPEAVGAGLRAAAALIRDAGFPGITVFRGRKPALIPWEEDMSC